MATEATEDERMETQYRAAVEAASTRVLEVEIDSRLHEILEAFGEQEGFDAGAELVAMALRELLRQQCSPEQDRIYRAILLAMHDQAAALRAGRDLYEDDET